LSYVTDGFILGNPPIEGGGGVRDSSGHIVPVLPGDIIQYRDVTVTYPDGSYDSASHHTAIIEAVNADGSYRILEQNWDNGKPDGRVVRESTINFNYLTYGHYWIYQPVAK
jgi:hypothetical protein